MVATVLECVSTRSTPDTFQCPALQPGRCSRWQHLSHILRMVLLGTAFQNSEAEITLMGEIAEDNHSNFAQGDLRDKIVCLDKSKKQG